MSFSCPIHVDELIVSARPGGVSAHEVLRTPAGSPVVSVTWVAPASSACRPTVEPWRVVRRPQMAGGLPLQPPTRAAASSGCEGVAAQAARVESTRPVAVANLRLLGGLRNIEATASCPTHSMHSWRVGRDCAPFARQREPLDRGRQPMSKEIHGDPSDLGSTGDDAARKAMP
jgi:hypothetical protein